VLALDSFRFAQRFAAVWLQLAIVTGKAEEGRNEVESMVLTKEDSGRNIVVHPGDQIEIRLEENPTTGYRWAQEKADEAVIQLVGTDFRLPQEPLVGQGGMRSFHFEATGPGEAVISLKYWQKWEGESSVTERFNSSVTVVG